MSNFARIAAVAATTLALSAGVMAMPAEAASKTGTITVKEATKVFNQILKQKCLTVKETRKIVHGKGNFYEEEDGWELYYDGAKKSKIEYAYILFDGKCVRWIEVGKR